MMKPRESKIINDEHLLMPQTTALATPDGKIADAPQKRHAAAAASLRGRALMPLTDSDHPTATRSTFDEYAHHAACRTGRTGLVGKRRPVRPIRRSIRMLAVETGDVR